MILSGRLSAKLAVLRVRVERRVAVRVIAVVDSRPAAHAADPVAINIVDVAGNLQLTQKAFEAFKAKYPQLVSNITFTNAPAPQLPGKIKAMQAAGRSDIDLVLTGTDALAAGIEQKLWMKLLPEQAAAFPGVLDKYAPGPRKMQDLAQGYGIEVDVHACRSADRIQPGQGDRSAEDARAIACVVQGASGQADLRAPG